MENVSRCCLTGYTIHAEDLAPIQSDVIEYTNKVVGRVRVSLPAYIELLNGDGEESVFPYEVLVGICRNAFERKEEAPLLTSDFIRTGYKKLNPPKNFEEKEKHYLKHLYLSGGAENMSFQINTSIDFPLAYSNMDEFSRIVDLLTKKYCLTAKNVHIMTSASKKLYMGVTMTEFGKMEVQKELPQMPMIGLVDQEITTGDSEVDEKIRHAKELFFKEFSDINDKRSACEALGFVLEPLRADLSSFFSSSDVSDIFQIINRFDIRHNNGLPNMAYEEQLEWVFYTLLNTISTYVKLKKKVSI